jgi:hypothetical protein
MSGLTEKLLQEIESASEPIQREALDFLLFLKAKEAAGKAGNKGLVALAQTAWAPDWDAPGEDEAWRDL